jgi:hypothetical protein
MLIHGKNLFPLERAIHGIKIGYFMDAAGNVYSTRTGNTLKQLSGSYTNSGRYFSLTRVNGSRYSPSISRHATLLVADAKAHKDFVKETSVPAWPTEPTASVQPHKKVMIIPTARNHAANVHAGIASKGWLIGQVVGEAIIFGSKPTVHTTDDSVLNELRRLASKKPGTKFVKLKIESALTLGAEVWE